MPTYEYECLACKHRFERFQKFSEPPVSECPECGSAVRKVLFPAGIVFKGSGWYITDSRPSSSSENGASGASTSTGAEGGAGEKKSEPATASKTEAKTEASGSPGSAKTSDSPKTSTTSSSTAAKA